MKPLSKDNILTIIPARGGSKRVKDKNIRSLAGKPLIQWTIDAALNSTFAKDHCYISTDCQKIKSIGQKCGARVPFLRPGYLATDDAPTFDAVKHMIDNLDESYDYILLLQPTSPLRTSKDIDHAIEILLKSNCRSIVSVTEADPHLSWQVTFDENERLEAFPNSNKRSQDLDKKYILNGAIYFSEIDYFLKHKSFLENETMVYIMDRNRSIDIDIDIEFKLAELIIENHE